MVTLLNDLASKRTPGNECCQDTPGCTNKTKEPFTLHTSDFLKLRQWLLMNICIVHSVIHASKHFRRQTWLGK